MSAGVQCIVLYFQCEFETCRDWRYQRHAQWLPATPGFLPPASDIGEIQHLMECENGHISVHSILIFHRCVCVCVFTFSESVLSLYQ